MVVWLHLVPDKCMRLSVSRKMEEEFEEEFEEHFLIKRLEDIDWDADWDEIEELGGGDDSLCCIKKGNISNSEEAQAKTTRFAKHVDDQICEVISERIPRNTLKSTNWGNSVLKLGALREISIKKLLTRQMVNVTSTFLGLSMRQSSRMAVVLILLILSTKLLLQYSDI